MKCATVYIIIYNWLAVYKMEWTREPSVARAIWWLMAREKIYLQKMIGFEKETAVFHKYRKNISANQHDFFYSISKQFVLSDKYKSKFNRPL